MKCYARTVARQWTVAGAHLWVTGESRHTNQEVDMIAVLFIVLLATCLAAPFLGADTSDAHSEAAHPEQGWFPAS
jgi:hypothetical protein